MGPDTSAPWFSPPSGLITGTFGVFPPCTPTLLPDCGPLRAGWGGHCRAAGAGAGQEKGGGPGSKPLKSFLSIWSSWNLWQKSRVLQPIGGKGLPGSNWGKLDLGKLIGHEGTPVCREDRQNCTLTVRSPLGFSAGHL